MAFTGQVTGQGRVWSDPSGRGLWAVPDGYDPQSSPHNPLNIGTPAASNYTAGTSLAATPALNTIPGVSQTPTPFADPAMNAPIFGTQSAPNPLAQAVASPSMAAAPRTTVTGTMDPNFIPGAGTGAGSGALGAMLGGGGAGGGSGPLTTDGARQVINSGGSLGNRPVIEEYGNINSNPSMGNQAAAAPQLPSDLTDALRQLMQNALDQGQRGQEAYSGITDDIRSFLNFNRDATTQSMGRQDELINSLMGRINPAIDQSLALMNQSQGLSPEAMAALRGQAMEGSATQYGQSVEALKTELARRGAAGGGDMPGSAGDIARGYGPLMASRDQQWSQGLRDAILADENRKFESLALNRQTAAQGLNTAAGLTGTLGQVYDPSKFLNASQNAMGQLTGIVGARNDQASGALGQAGALAQALAGNKLSDAQLAENARQADQSNATANRRIDLELAETSTGQVLKNALIGTGIGALTNLLGGGSNSSSTSSTVGGILSRIFGGGSDAPSQEEQMKGLTDIIQAGSLAGVAIPGLLTGLESAGGLAALAAEIAPAANAAMMAGVPGTAATAGATGSGGAMAGLTSLMTNPITIGIAAAAIGVIAWTKSQAHHEANTWVQGFQNPFDGKVGQLNDEFHRLAQSGQLTKQSASAMRGLISTAIDKYEQERIKFSRQGSDEKKVADQAKATADERYGKDYNPYLKKLDDVIAGLA